MPRMHAPPLVVALTLALSSFGATAHDRAGVSVKDDDSDPAASIFPSNRHTRRDWDNATFRRVDLPKPDCSVRRSDCDDIDVINTLDGFSTQPRITVPFTGPIDPASVTSETVYLVNLGDTLSGRGFGHKVGINQVVWDAATNTLAFESDELLAEHSRYLVVVTRGVRGADGKPIRPHAHDGGGRRDDRDMHDALRWHRHGKHGIAGASVFTTQSITADLRRIVRSIKASTPAKADFRIGVSSAGVERAVFPTATLAGIQFVRQTGIASFTPGFVPTPALNVVPGSVGRVAYGRFVSNDYATAQKFIPAVGTLRGTPPVQGSNELIFQLMLPASPKPAAGWPVAIFGHGFGDSMYGVPWTVASVLASQGIATLSINVVGHGGGALGTLNVLRAGAPAVQLPAGGRGIDQDGNGTIDSTEGVNAAAPRSIIGSRDGLRQTVIDLMQLVRQVELGMDVDGDGSDDLDAQRIYYSGQSFGGIYGTIFLGVEPALKAGVPNVPGGSITEVARLGVFRGLTGFALATRSPSLSNVVDPSGIAFAENMPLRNEPPRLNSVAGAMEIQKVLDRFEWVQQTGNPVSYARHIRLDPLRGQAAKPVLYQFATGDTVVPNPTTTAILRAGDLADTAVYFRNDLAWAANNAVGKNPHGFISNIGNPAAAAYAVGAQTQIAVFFASGGAVVIDPDGPGPYFEVPIVGPLPETLNYIP